MLETAPVDNVLRSPPSSHSLRGTGEGRASYYEPLMRVSFRHPYYNRDQDQCPDLAVRPTSFTQQMMQAHGLLFRDDGTSFSILYDMSRREALASWLERMGGDGGFWTRLSFVLSSRSPYFINVTDIPIDVNPLAQNFYFTNQEAHLDPALDVLLTPGPVVAADQLRRLTGAQYQARVLPHVLGIAVRDISGEIVLCEPRCIPEHTAAAPTPCLAWLAKLPPTSSDRCRDTIYLNFGMLPEDRYTIETIAGPQTVIHEDVRLYTAETPSIPLCFIDLLFSRPTEESAGIYPISGLAEDEAEISGVDYVINFDARATYWRYYIVPQGGATFDDLAIDCTAPDPALSFDGPWPVTIANGAPASLFVSMQPLLLQQQSIYRFRLKGRRRHRRLDDDTLVERLPVAAAEQVLPESNDEGRTRNYSDIYVYV